MTPPMTPREKVASAIRLHVSGAVCSDGRPGLGVRGVDEATDSILTVLASGSGDHAELAMLAEEASSGPWSVDADDIGRTIVASPVEIIARDTRHNSAFIAAANPATVLALLAENAALRAEIETLTTAGIIEVAVRNPSVADYVQHWEGRATEAERKLAEAVETSTRWAIWFAELRKAAGIGVKPMLSEVPGELRKMRSLIDRAAELMQQCTDPERFEDSSTLNVYANMMAWLSDLSKEAERG